MQADTGTGKQTDVTQIICALKEAWHQNLLILYSLDILLEVQHHTDMLSPKCIVVEYKEFFLSTLRIHLFY
jgi:hypothetical protein